MVLETTEIEQIPAVPTSYQKMDEDTQKKSHNDTTRTTTKDENSAVEVKNRRDL